MQIERTVLGEDSERVAQTESHLGLLYDRQGDTARAIEATGNAVKIASKRLGLNHYLTGYYLNALANLYLKANELAAAEESARQALAVFAQSLPAQHLYVATVRQTLGDVLLRRGLLPEAESELRSALDINTTLAGVDSWRTARSAASLGWILIKRDRAGGRRAHAGRGARPTAFDGGPAPPGHAWKPAHGWPNTTALTIAMPRRTRFSRARTSGKLVELSTRSGVPLATIDDPRCPYRES